MDREEPHQTGGGGCHVKTNQPGTVAGSLILEIPHSETQLSLSDVLDRLKGGKINEVQRYYRILPCTMRTFLREN